MNKRITKLNEPSKKKIKNYIKKQNGSDLNKQLNYKHKNIQNPSKENKAFCDKSKKRLNNRKKLKKAAEEYG